MRSLLFVPGDSARKFEKARQTLADALLSSASLVNQSEGINGIKVISIGNELLSLYLDRLLHLG